MASETTIRQCFALAATAGLRGGPPRTTDDERNQSVQTWAVLLSDMDDEDFKRGFMIQLRSSAFWPTPADILKSVKPPDLAEQWSAGYEMACKAAARHGSNRKPASSHECWAGMGELIYAGLGAVGGWRAFCMSGENDPAARAAFRDGFKTAASNRVFTDEQRKIHRMLNTHLSLPNSSTGE